MKICSYTYHHTHPSCTPDFYLLDASFAFLTHANPYLASTLPLSDINTFIHDFASTHELLSPTIIGLSLTDPYKRINLFVKDLITKENICGFSNFPSNAIIDGRFFQDIPQSQIGFTQELHAMKSVLTGTTHSLAFAFTPEQAFSYAQAGVQALALSPVIPPYWNLNKDSTTLFQKNILLQLRKDFPNISLLEIKYNAPFSSSITPNYDGAVWL